MIYLFDYMLLGFVITFIYFSFNSKEVKKMTKEEATGKFFIVWLIYPIVLLIELVKFLLTYFVYND